ncbi:2-methylisocitrate lyase-like PEP mutase family enzyme [Yoonia maricola]|uniref:2-methylisocitrate lyase-like PEP mutase family enzyme n=1 Tax=Yoonia maricola TaxID=420999 RepID=A0A2M8WL27_9RHOB|nr:isocitrate lyase/phosphoenolpyruvate mutase family protein [Yoonia maricola]PJI91628.1 2-methylisocitrate lyase-like PEP mutase family enzyme [Yoonia maricola]
MTHIADTFRALHVKGDPCLMVNVWDKGSAKMMAAMGAKALATSSAAHAFTLGRPDGGTVTRDEALAHAADIISVTNLPVQGDFENGFGDDPETCAETVRLAAEVGLAGICIEDIALPASSAYDYDHAVARIAAAAAAAHALPHDFVLTARADGIMTGAYDTQEGIRRLRAFEAVGADCLYAPLPPDMDALAKICASVQAPVNALVAGRFTAQTQAAFAKTGVARLSFGAALARVTHRALYDAAGAMLNAGDFSALKTSIGSDVIDALLQ